MQLLRRLSAIAMIAAFSATVFAASVDRQGSSPLSDLGPGDSEYSVSGLEFQIEAHPMTFRPSDTFWESFTKCDSESTVYFGGPHLFSTIGAVIAVKDEVSIEFRVIDPTSVEIEKIALGVSRAGVYFLRLEPLDYSGIAGTQVFAVVGEDTLWRVAW